MSQAKAPAARTTLLYDKRQLQQRKPDLKTATYTKGRTDNQVPAGHSMSVVTNYVAVNQVPEKVHVYRVDFAQIPASAADIESGNNNPRTITQRSQKARIFNALSHDHQGSPLLNKRNWATDYDFIWTLQPLTNDPEDCLNDTCIILKDVEYRKQGGRKLTVPQIAFYYLQTLTFGNGTQDLARGIKKQTLSSDLAKLTLGTNVVPPPTASIPNVLTTALNAMLTKHVTSSKQNKLHQVGANKFYVKDSVMYCDGIEIVRGYYSSVRPGEKAVLLNINPTHAAFIPPVLVSDFIAAIAKHNSDYKSAESCLRNKAARIIYTRPEPKKDEVNRNDEDFRVKTIADFGNIPDKQRFVDGDGKSWTVAEWFKAQGLPIKRPQAPCVNVGLRNQPPRAGQPKPKSGGELWIPAEYLELLPFQPFPKKLNPVHMQHMHEIALRRPADNQASLVNEGLPLLGIGIGPAAAMLKKHLEIQTGDSLLHIPARKLQPPTILYKPGTKESKKMPSRASWDLRGVVFYEPKPKPTQTPLGVIDLRVQLVSGEKSGRDLGHAFLQVLANHGLAAPPGPLTAVEKHVKCLPVTLPVPGKNDATWAGRNTAKLRESLMRVAGAPPPGCPPRVLVLLNDTDAGMYEGIKRLAETEYGYSTICATRSKVRGDPQPSLWSNLAVKFNIKGSGINHVVEDAGRPAFAKLEADTMVLGADVVHPGDNTPSIAAVVGSIDRHFVKMPGSIRLQGAREEIIEPASMAAMVEQRLLAYKKGLGKLPAHIIYYRDGVGEDQYSEVLDVEVPEIKRAHAALSKSPVATTGKPTMNMPGRQKSATVGSLKITVIVVGKRHNTRFFAPTDKETYPDKKGPGGLNGNVNPGFVVDTVITQPPGVDNFQDFFMQSHAALAGTARSAHYVVLQNGDPKLLTPTEIQRITHAFCYTYARATKGVSYCAPAYYADRLCDRAHGYLKGWLAETQAEAAWKMTPAEENMTKDAGQLAFRRRIRDEVANHQLWNRQRSVTRPGPWVEAMDGIMFWL